jgi:hypothetical protein
MSTLELMRQHRDEILRIATRHGARNVRVFGSVARNAERADSDVDLLIEAGPETTPWFPAGLIVDLEPVLGRHVDVVTDRGLNPLFRERVLSEAVAL